MTTAPTIRLDLMKQPRLNRSVHVPKSVAVVLVGVEYVAYEKRRIMDRLPGCHADLMSVHSMMKSVYKLDDQSMIILSDIENGRQFGSVGQPTRDGIRKSLQWLNRKGREGVTHLVFYYSGHGTQTVDRDGHESDGHDEALVPCDYQTAGLLIDDDISFELFSNLPASCAVTFISDSCNSGTICDLETRRSDAKVVSISGCMDSQTSASVAGLGSNAREWRGAMTFYLQSILKESKYNITCAELHKKMVASLKTKGLSQRPVLATSDPGLVSSTFMNLTASC